MNRKMSVFCDLIRTDSYKAKNIFYHTSSRCQDLIFSEERVIHSR